VSGEGSGRGAGQAPGWDLLADYASGALDGTREADRVTSRIADDPEWATAHRELLLADARIRDELAGLADLGAAEGMPADLIDRLGRALAAEPAPPAGGTGGDDDAGGVVRSLDEARRRRHRMLSAAAAVVVVLAGVGGFIGLANSGGDTVASSGSAVQGGPSPAGSGSGPAMGPNVLDGKASSGSPSGSGAAVAGSADRPVTLEVTGTDYEPATLATMLRTPTSEALPQQPDGPSLPSGAAAKVPAGLSRLTGSAALETCLGALSGVFASRPVLVDYARFRGTAALVTVIPTAQAGHPWLVVAGPDCGTGTADVRYQRRAS
jgi:hypothetical protein